MALKKLSITEEQESNIRELLAQKIAWLEISKRLNIPYAKLWRNLKIMGIENKSGWKKKKPDDEMFNWDKFKHYYNF